ncbi:hypothetical protein BDV39DRAFT_201905 [Aspergillus sergii]|uniref:D-isomer specific 2-hydroxyacid dehydrogenase NAD-binding domain-containing protein n=1 Tax=Aspergillus sergii TaxID=1034303 RepID=A0A5N6XB80_9EURO|nr:hypothetical protein BDV39DRAFT_201905 [Aspergillus sergii]
MQDTEIPREISQESGTRSLFFSHGTTSQEKNKFPICDTYNFIPPVAITSQTYLSLRTAMYHSVWRTVFTLFEHWDNQKRETWATPETDEDVEDAVGLRMDVLGYGCTDHQCARLANAPGMDVHAFTLHERPIPECKRDHSYVEAGMGDPNGDIPSRWCHGCDQLNEFLAGLDLLVITLPLTSLTRGMIAREQFQTLGKRNSFVGNVGRGPIVNTDDLVDALNNGTIRGAAVDVTDPEPLSAGHPLWEAKNVIITPHVGGNSTQYSKRVLKVLARNLKNIAEGKELINKVNKSLSY